jgi:hypothetical protein
MTVRAAINRLRRDLTIAATLRMLLLFGTVAGVTSIAIGPMHHINGLAVLTVIAFIWMALMYYSLKGSRLASDSPSLIAAGQLDEAEHRIEAAIRSFSLSRTVKLLSLHHLAVLRHAQRRWQDSAQLCSALLSQRLGSIQGLSRSSLLLLTDDLLQLGDLNGTYQALRRLFQQRLTLAEATTLLQLQLEYLARIGQWDQLLVGVAAKVQLIELMPTAAAARSQGLMSVAAMHVGRTDLAQWLGQRALALSDIETLCTERPVLQELRRLIPAPQIVANPA